MILDLLPQIGELLPYMSDGEVEQLSSLIAGVPTPEMSLVQFVKEAWRLVEPNTPYQHNWHIDAICQHLTACTYGIIKNLLINIQPRHMKSLLVSVFWPTWAWTFVPHTQWLFISHKQPLSIRDNLKRRRIITSDWYIRGFANGARLTRDQRQKSWFENVQGGHMITAGMSGVTGLGADFIVGDDILAREDANSKARRERAKAMWDETISTRGNDPDTVVKVMIAQRLHVDDPVGHIMETEKKGGDRYDRLIIRTEYEPDNDTSVSSIGWRDPRTKEGELLWPARYSRETINRLKITLGSLGTAAQLQQSPVAAGGNIIKAEWWRFWRPAGSDLPPVTIKIGDGKYIECPVVDLPDAYSMQVHSWDMAFKNLDTGSYVSGQVWRKTTADFYLIAKERGHMNFPETLEALERMKNAYDHNAILVEAAANGHAVVQTLSSKISGLIPINVSDSKEGRAHAVSPLIEAGNVYIPHPAMGEWIWDFIDETREFPASVHNDQVDSMTQALLYLSKRPEKKPRAGAWGRKK